MYLRHIALRDWKAFVDARFEFPAPNSRRNVVLIGARNGYGKTSLFEAIVLGLFGRDGLPLIARAPFSGAGEEKLQLSYNDFLSGALFRNAQREGRSSASVELAFHDDEDGPTILRRVWHFSSSGQHKPHEEEVRIYAGNNERPVAPPFGEDRNEWLRAYIARRFLPYYLAAFFMFDGEQVQALAKRDMSAQVRNGIEGLLGIPVLRELADDLTRYADNRRYSVGGASDETFRKVQEELLSLEAVEAEAKQKLEQAVPELEMLRAERESLTRELGSYGNASEALLRERLEELNRHKRALEELFDKLHEQLATDIAMGLAGPELRAKVIERLRQEEVRELWEAGRAQSSNVDRFLKGLVESCDSLSPQLTEEQTVGLSERVRQTWESLWHPAPEGCAPDYRHNYVRSGERAAASERLKHLGTLPGTNVVALLAEIAQREADKRRLEAEVAQTQGLSAQTDVMVARLREIAERLEVLASEKATAERDIQGVSGQIAAKRQELARLAATRDAAAPGIRRARQADKVAALIQEIIQDAVPGQIQSVARAMTESYKAMAHKSLVDRVEIGLDCTVKLLSASGRDVYQMAQSAGEQQIFAQALIAAIANVADRDFPIIVDTPLARLDDRHRAGVLRHFTATKGQVILLSTDTEVVGSYLDVVKPRLSKTFHLLNEHDGDVGRSRAESGYFPETGV